MKKINIILIITLVLLFNCRFGQTSDTNGKITVKISASSVLAPNGCLLLQEDSTNLECIVVNESDGVKEYTFQNLPIFSADSGYRRYTISYFVDTDGNLSYDADNQAEKASLVKLTETTFTDPYSTELPLGPFAFVKYEGKLKFREQVGSDSSREYLVLRDSANNYRYYPLPADNSISIYQKKADVDEWASYDLYYLYDTDNDKKMDAVNDYAVFLATLSGSYSNPLLDRQITKIYGVIDYNGTDSRFDVNATNPPVIQIQDQSYWKSHYTKVKTDNTFTAYIPEENAIELRLYHVGKTLGSQSFNDNFKDHLKFPVKLISGTGKEVAEDLNGTTGNSTMPKTYSILPVRSKAVNRESLYNEYNLGLIAGYTTISFLLYDSNDTVLNGQLGSGGTLVTFYTLKNSAPTAGAKFEMATFFDVNRDGLFNVGEPTSSSLVKYGDLNETDDRNSTDNYYDVVDGNGTYLFLETFTRPN